MLEHVKAVPIKCTLRMFIVFEQPERLYDVTTKAANSILYIPDSSQ